MRIASETELMENHKQGKVLAPEGAFTLLPGPGGRALYFSLGSDGAFYLTREVEGSSTGWIRSDLGASITGGRGRRVKAFAATHNPASGRVDLALVVTVDGVDGLHVSLDATNTDAGWAAAIPWTAIPFDGQDAGTNPSITAVQLISDPEPAVTGKAGIYVQVAPAAAANHPPGLYFVAPDGSPRWRRATHSDGSLPSCLFRSRPSAVSICALQGPNPAARSLTYIDPPPQANQMQPPMPLSVPDPPGVSAVAAAFGIAGESMLFASASNGLYLLPPVSAPLPAPVVTDPLFHGLTSLAAAGGPGGTAVLGLTPQRTLVHAACPPALEKLATAWSPPAPLLANVSAFDFFLGQGTGCIVVAACVGASLVLLSQDPATRSWRQGQILLPSTDPNDLAAFSSFTTHIQVSDDNGIGAPNTAVTLSAASAVGAYVNDQYRLFLPGADMSATTDSSGVLTIVQATQSLAAVSVQVVIPGAPPSRTDPLDKARTKLAGIKSPADLDRVLRPDGKPLLAPTVPPGDKAALVNNIQVLLQAWGGLPADGSRSQPAAPPAEEHKSESVGDKIKGGLDDAIHDIKDVADEGASKAADAAKSAAADAGTVLHVLRGAPGTAKSLALRMEGGLCHLATTVEGKSYDVALDCHDAVAHALEVALNGVELAFDDAVQWLGAIFEWGDILRTHQVLRTLFRCYAAKAIAALATARADIKTAFDSVQGHIDEWAKLETTLPSSANTTFDKVTAALSPAPGRSNPLTNWVGHHFKNNLASTTIASAATTAAGDLEAVLKPLTDALANEQKTLQGAYDGFKSGVIDKIHQLTPLDVIKAVAGLLANGVIGSVENVLLAAVDVFRMLVQGALDLLQLHVEIPVLSPVYREVAGADLSLLDLICLVLAVPVTVMSKLVSGGRAPFPDTAGTKAIINAPDFTALQRVVVGTSGAPLPAAANVMVVVRDSTFTPATAGVNMSTSDSAINDVTPALDLATGISALFAAEALNLLMFAKEDNKAKKIPTLDSQYALFTAVFYIPYASPSVLTQLTQVKHPSKETWYGIMDEVIADIMIGKAMADAGVAVLPISRLASSNKVWQEYVSPWWDFAGNFAWQAPTVGVIFDTANISSLTATILGMVAGTAFDSNGMMSPALAITSDDPKEWLPLALIAAFLNSAYGDLQLASSIISYKSG